MGSAIVLAAAFLLISLVWYPGVLFAAAAGSELLRLMIGVDLIIGPVVMLIIYNPTKPKIKQDVLIVLLCQLAFLFFGLWSIFSARPVYIAFSENRFYLVRANEIDVADQKKVTQAAYQHLPLFGPELVGTQQPEGIKERNDIVFGTFGGMGIQNLPQYFVPIVQVQQAMLAAGKTSQNWQKIDAANKQRLQQYEATHKSVLFLLLTSKRESLFVVIDSKTGVVLEII